MGHRSVVSTVHCIAAPFSWMFKVTLCRGSSFGMYQEPHKTFPDLVMYDSSRENSRHCIYGTFDGIYVEQRINPKFLSSLSHGCEIIKIQSGSPHRPTLLWLRRPAKPEGVILSLYPGPHSVYVKRYASEIRKDNF